MTFELVTVQRTETRNVCWHIVCTEGAWWGSDSTLDTDDSYWRDKISFYKRADGGHVMNTNMNKYFTFITNRYTQHDAYDKMLPYIKSTQVWRWCWGVFLALNEVKRCWRITSLRGFMISSSCKYYEGRINPGGGLVLRVLCMGDNRYEYKVSVGEPETKWRYLLAHNIKCLRNTRMLHNWDCRVHTGRQVLLDDWKCGSCDGPVT